MEEITESKKKQSTTKMKKNLNSSSLPHSHQGSRRQKVRPPKDVDVAGTKDQHNLFLENIRSLRLKVPERFMSDQEGDIKKYLEERRKRYPTHSRIETSAKTVMVENGEGKGRECMGKKREREDAETFTGGDGSRKEHHRIRGKQRKERKRMDGREEKEGDRKKRKDAPSLWEKLVSDQMEEEERMIIEIFKHLQHHVMSLDDVS
jgi:hypothetical protein